MFQRQVVSPRQSGPVWRTTVEVAIPNTVPTGGVGLDSTGSPTRHDLIDGHTAWFEGTDLSNAGSLTVVINLSGGITGLSSPSVRGRGGAQFIGNNRRLGDGRRRIRNGARERLANPLAHGNPNANRDRDGNSGRG